MASPVQVPDFIGDFFGSSTLKGVLAVATIVGALGKYIRESGERNSRAATIAQRYGLTDAPYWIVNRLPHILHQTVAYAVLVMAALQIVVLIDQTLLNTAIFNSVPGWAQSVASFISRYFVFLFMIAILFYALFEFRGIERLLALLTGLFPRLRNSLGWTNARWQINADEKERRIIAPADNGVERIASQLVGELVEAPRNEYLALRPMNLNEEHAGNVLYFGHVIEEYRSSIGGSPFPWTQFYEALARVAALPEAPFSPGAIRQFTGWGNFFQVLLRANEHLGDAWQIPNDAGLENAIKTKFDTLRDELRSDARTLAGGFSGTTYSQVLNGSKIFLESEGMRRQFAKLFILWNVVPGASHPDVFRIPFNTKMFIRYLDDGILRVDGDRFDYTTDPVNICFDVVQQQVLSRVKTLLDETQDEARVRWREAERNDVNARRLDWNWWVYYRADQQAYRDAREHKSEAWKVEADKEIVRAKAK